MVLLTFSFAGAFSWIWSNLPGKYAIKINNNDDRTRKRKRIAHDHRQHMAKRARVLLIHPVAIGGISNVIVISG